jgi:glycosyltransferase involved in cell wall biosynthesis
MSGVTSASAALRSSPVASDVRDDQNGRIGIIALVPDLWQGIWMPRHQVLSRLAERYDVVWVQPSENWRKHWLPWERRQRKRAVQMVSPDIGRLKIYESGRWMPEVHRPRRIGRWLRRRRLAWPVRYLKRQGCDRIVLYLWRPKFAWAADAIPADLVCYHIDDEYDFSRVDRPIDAREFGLIKSADLVFIHSPRLLEKKGGINSNTLLVPNGVDYRAFSVAHDEPADLAAIDRPRIGYVGVIKDQLDLDLLLRLSQQRPDWSFVLVGPRGYVGKKESTIAALEQRPNVHFLGNRQLRELPGYTQHMDVCIMCYEVNDYTNCIYPLKLHEYLASGRPVVSSRISSVLAFEQVVQLADTAEEWEFAIERSLSPDSTSLQAIKERRGVASDHDWSLLVDKIAGAIQSRLSDLQRRSANRGAEAKRG